MSRKLTLALAAFVALAASVYFLRSTSPIVPLPEKQTAVAPSTPSAIILPSPAPTGTSQQLIEGLVTALPALEPEQRDEATRQLIRKLREQGTNGLQAVAEFLRSGRDVPFRDGYRMEGLRIVEAPSLRIALLDALQDWEGSTAVLLDFLKSPAPIWELVLAARNLELQFPGTYRDPAIASLKASLSRRELPPFGAGGEAHLFATAAHFKAVEILPELERVTAQTRGPNLPRHIQLLNTLPPETRAPALDRLFTHPEIADEIELAPQTLNQWPYGDPRVQAYVAGVFANRLNVQQRVAMLDGFDAATPVLSSDESLFTSKQNARERDQAAAKDAIAEAQARKAFLTSLAKTPDQPAEVQEAIKDAQKRITEDLAMRQTAERSESQPLVEVPIGLGDGKAQIKGRRIEQIELKPASVIPPDENSTEGPLR